MVRKGIISWGCALGLIWLSGAAAAADPGTDTASNDAGASSRQAMDGTLAVVGGEKISIEEYQANLRVSYRQRFFHGTIPKDELKAFRRDVADSLIDNVLLRQEAERRGIKPDPEVGG